MHSCLGRERRESFALLWVSPFLVSYSGIIYLVCPFSLTWTLFGVEISREAVLERGVPKSCCVGMNYEGCGHLLLRIKIQKCMHESTLILK